MTTKAGKAAEKPARAAKAAEKPAPKAAEKSAGKPGEAAGSPRFFATPAKLRAWLGANHEKAAELWVGFHKVGSGKPSITWPQSVDEALCVGWIDGIRRSIDSESYTIRFTPRRAASKWSAVNLRRIAELIAEGRVLPAGLRAFEARPDPSADGYTYVQIKERRKSAVLGEAYEQRFRAHPAAWEYFQAQAAWYRQVTTHWVVSAKREETRERRLASLIEASAAGRPIRELYRPDVRK